MATVQGWFKFQNDFANHIANHANRGDILNEDTGLGINIFVHGHSEEIGLTGFVFEISMSLFSELGGARFTKIDEFAKASLKLVNSSNINMIKGMYLSVMTQ